MKRKKILYVDMDNVLVDFRSALPNLHPGVLRKYRGRLDEIPGIFGRMKPIPRAISSFKRLAEHFDTFILSTSPWENPSAWSDKLVWVKEHLGASAYKRLILSHHKDLNLGHFLIDDRRANGADNFYGEHIHFGTKAFPDWKGVVKYLLLRAEN